MRDSSSIDKAIGIAAYKTVFLGGVKGKDVLYDILANCGIDDGTFCEDPYKQAFLAGRRSVAIDLLGKLNMDVRDVLTQNTTMEDIE